MDFNWQRELEALRDFQYEDDHVVKQLIYEQHPLRELEKKVAESMSSLPMEQAAKNGMKGPFNELSNNMGEALNALDDAVNILRGKLEFVLDQSTTEKDYSEYKDEPSAPMRTHLEASLQEKIDWIVRLRVDVQSMSDRVRL